MQVLDNRPVDRLDRSLRDLRISVTDRCNFRCTYCMPEEKYHRHFKFLTTDERLDFEEILRLTRLFALAGVRKLRITGGEPLLRPALGDLIGDLRSTWLLDIDLPDGPNDGDHHRLEMNPPEGTPWELRYPEYWRPGDRIESLTRKAEEAIAAVAEAQGIDMVLFKQQTIRLGTNQQGRVQAANINVVAWASDTVDVTDAVAQHMNNAFDNSR